MCKCPDLSKSALCNTHFWWRSWHNRHYSGFNNPRVFERFELIEVNKRNREVIPSRLWHILHGKIYGLLFFDFHRLSGIYPPWVGGPPSPQLIRSPKAAASHVTYAALTSGLNHSGGRTVKVQGICGRRVFHARDRSVHAGRSHF